jgi:glycine cleavage system H protein
MEQPKRKTLHYKRSHFATQLPVDYFYSPSHFWLGLEEEGIWRVGLTRFAARMLGEMVDHGFEAEPQTPVQPGQVLGWVEGFKAISDLYCAAEGIFLGGNPGLKEQISLINKDCHGAGWLYRVKGSPDARCLDVHGYIELLDKTIDKILEQQEKRE